MDRGRRIKLSLAITLVLFVAGTVAMTTYTLWLLRTNAVKNGLEVSALLSRSFEDFLTQSLNVTELVGAQFIWTQGVNPSEQKISADFVAILRRSPYLRSVSILDENDAIIASSNPVNIGFVVKTQDFLPTVTGTQSVLRIGQPWAGRDFSVGKPLVSHADAGVTESFIPLTQSVSMGMRKLRLLVGLNPDYFVQHMAQQLGSDAGFVEVRRLDGTLLMTTMPESGGRVGQKVEMQKLRFDDVEFGQIEQDEDGHLARLTSFRVSSLYPFVVVTHIHRDFALQHWQTEVRTILSVLVPTVLAICLLAMVLYRRQIVFEAQRTESERLLRINAAKVFSNSREGIMITAADGSIVDVNEAFTRITGYEREEVLTKNPRLLSSGRQDKAFYQGVWRELSVNGYWSGEIWNRRKDGELFAVLQTISTVTDTHGKVQQYLAQFSNITSIKEYQQQLENMAHFDTLTKLPNRTLFVDRLHQAMSLARRRAQRMALVFIDLDGFKSINDLYGHAAGDQLLITVANRMRKVLRDSDSLSRQGGDEFVAILVDVGDELACVSLLTRLLSLVSEPVQFNDYQLHISASVGVSFYPQPADIDANQLMAQADHAMYQAKRNGKNRYHFFEFESVASLA